jgi:hypothetical protein
MNLQSRTQEEVLDLRKKLSSGDIKPYLSIRSKSNTARAAVYARASWPRTTGMTKIEVRVCWADQGEIDLKNPELKAKAAVMLKARMNRVIKKEFVLQDCDPFSWDADYKEKVMMEGVILKRLECMSDPDIRYRIGMSPTKGEIIRARAPWYSLEGSTRIETIIGSASDYDGLDDPRLLEQGKKILMKKMSNQIKTF